MCSCGCVCGGGGECAYYVCKHIALLLLLLITILHTWAALAAKDWVLTMMAGMPRDAKVAGKMKYRGHAKS